MWFTHFVQMENVSNFLKACRAVGVAEHSLFETVDLYEGKDLGLVVRCLVRPCCGRTDSMLTVEHDCLFCHLVAVSVHLGYWHVRTVWRVRVIDVSTMSVFTSWG